MQCINVVLAFIHITAINSIESNQAIWFAVYVKNLKFIEQCFMCALVLSFWVFEFSLLYILHKHHFAISRSFTIFFTLNPYFWAVWKWISITQLIHSNHLYINGPPPGTIYGFLYSNVIWIYSGCSANVVGSPRICSSMYACCYQIERIQKATSTNTNNSQQQQQWEKEKRFAPVNRTKVCKFLSGGI